jgi:hypothetical protein
MLSQSQREQWMVAEVTLVKFMLWGTAPKNVMVQGQFCDFFTAFIALLNHTVFPCC